jgi:Ca2+-binding EF-hand superfamily protein
MPRVTPSATLHKEKTMSSISALSGSSNAWAALSSQRSQHQAKMFAKVDTDGSGGVEQTELSSMLSDISAKSGTSLGDSKELFSKMDSNADGSLSSDELAQGMKALMPPPSTMDFAQSRSATGSSGTQAGQRPDGPPPAGGPGGADGTSTASGSSTTYDPLDINQDGTVSEMERLAGALKQLATTQQTDSSGNSASSEIAKLAQKLYEQIRADLHSSGKSSSTSSSQLSATA